MTADKKSPHLHIVGIAGTAMSAVALLAREQGWRVTGSDADIYPPISDVLADAGIVVDAPAEANLDPAPNLCLIGNAVSRGHVEVEAILRRGLRYSSGAAFLGERILPGRHAVVVAGTHGKTSTSSLLAYILYRAGYDPGFMIGGMPENFSRGANLGAKGAPFVLEGDEYDTALFDKRSKFLHYHARTLILNNLEYDHADIFPDLEAIRIQFAHLLRTVPDDGLIIANADEPEIQNVLDRGCWTPVVRFARRNGDARAQWHWQAERRDGRAFTLWRKGEVFLRAKWSMLGEHQVSNACAAVAAAHHLGVDRSTIIEALHDFAGVRRRMTLVANWQGVRVFDDFAHHPTAIRCVIQAAAAQLRTGGRLWVILDPRSHTMRGDWHRHALTSCFDEADRVFCLRPPSKGMDPSCSLDIQRLCAAIGAKATPITDAKALSPYVHELRAADDILILSNGPTKHIHHILHQIRSTP